VSPAGEDILDRLRAFICGELMQHPGYPLQDDEALMSGGLIDSFSVAYIGVADVGRLYSGSRAHRREHGHLEPDRGTNSPGLNDTAGTAGQPGRSTSFGYAADRFAASLLAAGRLTTGWQRNSSISSMRRPASR